MEREIQSDESHIFANDVILLQNDNEAAIKVLV